jgi:hypothetical protein
MKFKGDGRRFPQAFCIYEGGLLADQYDGNIIAPNSLTAPLTAPKTTRICWKPLIGGFDPSTLASDPMARSTLPIGMTRD